jgi:hypothetical protein
MPKRLKILFILISILTLASVLFFRWDLYLWRSFTGLWDNKNSTEESESQYSSVIPTKIPSQDSSSAGNQQTDLKELPAGFSFSSPVGQEYLENFPVDPENPKTLSLLLPVGVSIRAVFSGAVKKIIYQSNLFQEGIDLDQILLEKDDGEILANYLVKGEIKVKEGDSVEENSVLAITSNGGSLNFTFWLNDKNGDFIKLSEQDFKE